MRINRGDLTAQLCYFAQDSYGLPLELLKIEGIYAGSCFCEGHCRFCLMVFLRLEIFPTRAPFECLSWCYLQFLLQLHNDCMDDREAQVSGKLANWRRALRE